MHVPAGTVGADALVAVLRPEVVPVDVVAAEVGLLVELLPHAASTARLASTVAAPRQRRVHVFIPPRLPIWADATQFGGSPVTWPVWGRGAN